MTTKTFVLIHGAWHGGWCWYRLTDVLRARGHIVHALTLAAGGFRKEELSPEITLSTHTNEVVQYLFYEDLHDVCLIGHSYGGMVTSGVVELAPDRVGNAIWLDAFLPDHGDSVSTLAPEPSVVSIAEQYGEGYYLPPFSSSSGFGISDPDEVVWTDTRLTRQPLGTFTESANVHPQNWKLSNPAFISTTPVLFPEFAERARERGYAVISHTDWGHNSMQTHADELTDLLVSLA